MDHKIKPTATRLGISNTWPTISYYSNIIEDQFITKTIKNILLKFKILTSDISIKKFSNYYIIIFCYYPLMSESTDKNINEESSFKQKNRLNDNSNLIIFRVYSIIKGILSLYLGKRIYFKTVQVPSFVTNAEILASWIQLELIKKPKLHKSIILRVIKEFKRWSE